MMKNIEYENHREKNRITVDMYNILWQLLNDSTTITIGSSSFKPGFFEEWKERDRLLNHGNLTWYLWRRQKVRQERGLT
jgi:hypothetical protein